VVCFTAKASFRPAVNPGKPVFYSGLAGRKALLPTDPTFALARLGEKSFRSTLRTSYSIAEAASEQARVEARAERKLQQQQFAQLIAALSPSGKEKSKHKEGRISKSAAPAAKSSGAPSGPRLSSATEQLLNQVPTDDEDALLSEEPGYGGPECQLTGGAE